MKIEINNKQTIVIFDNYNFLVQVIAQIDTLVPN